MARVMTAIEHEVFSGSARMNEDRDCAVKATALVTDVSYEVAHAALKAQGRKNRCGTYPVQYRSAIAAMGFEVRKVEFKRCTVRTIGAQLRRGKFLVRVNRHVLAVVDGKVMDWTDGRLHRVKDVYEVVSKGAPVVAPAAPIVVAPAAPVIVKKPVDLDLLLSLMYGHGATVAHLAARLGTDTNTVRAKIDLLRRRGRDIRNTGRNTFCWVV